MSPSSSLLASAMFVTLASIACSSSSSDPGSTSDAATVADGDKSIDTAPPKTCSDLVCPKYECTCNDGSKITASGCTDAVCNSGTSECNTACGSSGGMRSFKEVGSPTTTDAGTDTAPSCIKSGDACGDCVATSCCAEGAACADDKACQAIAVCVALKCTGTWEKCAAECETTSNPTFDKYSACIVAKGCATKCKG